MNHAGSANADEQSERLSLKQINLSDKVQKSVFRRL